MSKIKVALRVRPLSSREKEEGHIVVVGLEEKSAFITDIRVPEKPSADSRQRLRQFDFDHVFWLSRNGLEGGTQSSIFSEMGPSLENSILTGHNATILCYGQSGTGKTHTMLGTKEDPGLIPRLCQSLWEKLKGQETRKSNFLFEVSFMEIYREKVRDLLVNHSEKVLKLREHPQLGAHVQGLTRIQINEEWEFLNLLWEGERRRAIGATGTNRRSSRSHAIWTLYLTSSIKSDTTPAKGSGLITRTNRVHLVDLAGSEKADLITTKNLLAEGKDINRSLVSLGNVISSLAEKANYIPYRDSTLTFLLKDSLGGNSSTSIIITASPASCCHAQTLNSFRFAQRARLVENQPKINLFHQANDPAALYGMSANEIKKDISRLANIIRSAQNVSEKFKTSIKENGGILRGLTSRHSWNRLITAIENWNHNEKQNQLLRANSDGTNSSRTTTSISTSTMTNSLTDVQAEFRCENNLRVGETSSTSSSSVPNSTSMVTETEEVLSPCSSAIKCTTWKQENVQQIPKMAYEDSDSDSFVSPPTSPIPNIKVNQLKYLLQVHYPTMHCLRPDSRLSEKIYENLINEFPEIVQILPIEVQSDLEAPVVREKFPTLVGQCQLTDDFDEITSTSQNDASNISGMSNSNGSSSLSSSNSSSYNGNMNEGKKVKTSTPIPFDDSGYINSINNEIPQFGFKIPKVSEFLKSSQLLITPMESTDEFEEDDLAVSNSSFESSMHEFGRYRVIPSNKTEINHEERNDALSFDDFSMSSSSSSSYESLVMKPNILHKKVKVVENSTFNFNSIEDKLDCIQNNLMDSIVFPLEQHVAKMCFVDEQEKAGDYDKSVKTNSNDPLLTKDTDRKNSMAKTTSTKFRMHFMKEINQMENIGKQIQNLRVLTNRHHVVKPYIDKIIELQGMDHRKPDPKLDAEIEECSGWNINIELARVQKDITNLNKILKVGGTFPNTTNPNINLSTTNSVHDTTSPSSDNNSDSQLSQKSSHSSSTSSSNFKNPTNQKRVHHRLYLQQKHPSVTIPITPQPRQSWNLQFPLSSNSQQSKDLQGPKLTPPNANSFSQNYNNFQKFHFEAQQRHAQRWQPILPKTHDYLYRTHGGVNYKVSDDYDGFDCRKSFNPNMGSNPNFYSQPQYVSQLYNNTSFQNNPALLYPTNFPQQQQPPSISFDPSHTSVVNNYQCHLPPTAPNNYHYEPPYYNVPFAHYPQDFSQESSHYNAGTGSEEYNSSCGLQFQGVQRSPKIPKRYNK